MLNTRYCNIFVALGAYLFSFQTAFADPHRNGLDFGTSISGSYEARNTLIQPAALGFDTELNGADFTSSLAYGTNPDSRGDFNLAMAWGMVGFGAERFESARWSRFQFALGAPLTPSLFAGVRLGLSRFDSGAAMDSWDLGLQFRPTKHLSVGLLANGVNTPKLSGNNQPTEFVAALTLRPIPQIDLSIDVSNQNYFSGRYEGQGMLHWNIAEGVRLRAGYHTQYQWLAGVQIHFGNVSLFSTFAPQAGRKFVMGFQSGTRPYASAIAPAHSTFVAIGSSLSDERYSGTLFANARPSLLGLLQTLEGIRKDPHTRRVLVRLDTFPLGLASAHEVFLAMQRVRKSGKNIDVFLSNAGIKEYLIASAASTIHIEPAGEIRWLGLKAEHYFLKGTLDKIGVEAEFLAAGKYKSAPEMFTRKESSEVSRTSTLEELRDLQNTLIELLVQERGFDKKRWAGLLDLGLLSAEEAKREGLVDGIRSFSAVAANKSDWDYPAPYAAPRKDRLALPPRIGVVVAAGNILPTKNRWLSIAGTDLVTPPAMSQKLALAKSDARTAGVVLRVASPGGEVLASQKIAAELEILNKTKPVTVSMGDIAASGGYYIAAPSRRILAGPMTLTGSIGVFLGKFSFAELFKKIDLHKELLTDAPYPGLYSEHRAWNAKERLVMERRLKSYYSDFLAHVGRFRGLDSARVESVAQGRVWTGKQAKKQNLVDEMGGYQEAIESAASAAGLDPSEVEAWEIESDSGWFDLPSLDALTKANQAPVELQLLTSPFSRQELQWLSTIKDSRFLYLAPLSPPDA